MIDVSLIYCAWGDKGSFPENEFVTSSSGLRVHLVEPLHTTKGNLVERRGQDYRLIPEDIPAADAAPVIAFGDADRGRLDQPLAGTEH